jgi:hypothetical protein
MGGSSEPFPEVILQHGEGTEVGIEIVEWNAAPSLEKGLSPLDLPRLCPRLIVKKGIVLPGVPLARHAQSSPIESDRGAERAPRAILVARSSRTPRWAAIPAGVSW